MGREGTPGITVEALAGKTPIVAKASQVLAVVSGRYGMKHAAYAGISAVNESDVWTDMYLGVKVIVTLKCSYSVSKILYGIGPPVDGCEETCSLNQTFMQHSPCGHGNIVEPTACGTGLFGIR